jgi:hypothetical protein
MPTVVRPPGTALTPTPARTVAARPRTRIVIDGHIVPPAPRPRMRPIMPAPKPTHRIWPYVLTCAAVPIGGLAWVVHEVLAWVGANGDLLAGAGLTIAVLAALLGGGGCVLTCLTHRHR